MSDHAAINRAYSLVWSDEHAAYVVVPEGTRRRGKAGRAALGTAVTLAALLGSGAALADPALPSGGRVTAGAASIGTSGSTLTVNQSTARTAIDWNSFSIGAGATVNFVQPNASSVALNRVVGNEGSLLDGALNANGQVFVLNPNGVLIGRTGQVDTAGFVASTLNLSDAEFMAGRSSFSAGGSKGSVINLGTIVSKDGGYAALLGQQVRNEGTITAKLGTAVLAAGDRVSLNFNGDSLVGVTVDQATLGALVQNKQAILVDGGLVVLTAKGLDAVLATVVNNTGEIRAQTISNHEGRVFLLGDGGSVNVAGSIDASAPNGGNGGFVETSGPKVRVAEGASISTRAPAGRNGNWLIDPTDFTIAATGGDMSGAALSGNLQNGSVTIQSSAGAGGTNGNVYVNDAVNWGANTTLTLQAQHNIYVYANITATGASGQLAFQYGQGAVASGNTSSYTLYGAQINLRAGPNFSTKLGSDGAVTNWTVITSLGSAGSSTDTDLQGVVGSGNYVLGADIAAGATAGWNAGLGFAPLSLTGNFDGFGHKIDGLTINKPTNDFNGLFGSSSGTIQNLGLTNANVTSCVSYWLRCI